jgi:hypothetical protein
MKRLFCVIMFLMFGVASLAFSATKFIETDDKTGGAWEQKYGADGYIFSNTNGPQGVVVAGADAVKKNDVAKLPNYIEDYILSSGIGGFVWLTGDVKPKVIAMPDGKKNAACWYTGSDATVDLPLKRSTTYTLAVYMDDWENGGRKQSLTLKDLKTGEELASENFEQYGVIGKYGVFQVDRSVQLVIHFIASYANGVVSGVFFHGGGLAVVSPLSRLATTWAEIKK